MRTFKAILLNIFYPGTGYLYLKDDFRKTIAKFLIFAWTFFIVNIIYNLFRAFVGGEHYLFSGSNEFPNQDFLGIPSLAWGMWGFMIYDTYRLAKEQHSRRPNSQKSK